MFKEVFENEGNYIISEDTLRVEDVLYSMLDVYDGIVMEFGSDEDRDRYNKIDGEVNDIAMRYSDEGLYGLSFTLLNNLSNEDYYTLEDILDEVIREIDYLIPNNYYIGSHEGNSSCIGIWKMIEDDDDE